MKKCHLALEITHWVISELDLPLNCEFSYDTRDPLAITLVFDTDAEDPVRWIFSRELLAEGMTAPAGEGDVVLWPELYQDGEPSAFCVQVGSVRTALFEIPIEPVAQWLAQTYDMVPQGTELDGVDWDELVQLAE